MSYAKTTYVAKPVDENGVAHYTEEENSVWHDLFKRQFKIVKDRACQEYINGLKLLNLPPERIPQCFEVTEVLKKTTGWSLEPVPALIPFEHFFDLLAQCKLEVNKVEQFYHREKIPFLSSTTRSIEEIASSILATLGLKRRLGE